MTTTIKAGGRQAITTKFLGPTDYKGSRVKATCEAGSVTLSWDHALNSDGNHEAACRALMAKLGWDGERAGGWLGGGKCVFVEVVR